MEISQDTQDRLDNILGLTDKEKEEIILMIEMAYSKGRMDGYREGSIITKAIGNRR